MSQKVYITSNQMITFSCPECQHPRIVSIAEHKGLEKAINVRVTCKRCGHKYRATIERRQQYRKAVNLPGTYTHLVNGRLRGKGYMTVVDLSRTGLKLKLNDKGGFAIGDRLMIEFSLDDANHSLIKKEVEIKKIDKAELGVAFLSMHPSNSSDKALGFYMFG
jgi:transcription elongation factor Elf1